MSVIHGFDERHSPTMSSFERQPPRRAKTLPVRFNLEPNVEPRVRGSRRRSRGHRTQGHADDGSDSNSYDQDFQTRTIRDDRDGPPRKAEHNEPPWTFPGEGDFVQRRQRVECGSDDSDDEPTPVLPGFVHRDLYPEAGVPRPRVRVARGHNLTKYELNDRYGGYGDSGTDSDENHVAYDFNLTRRTRSPLVGDSTVGSATGSERAFMISESQVPSSGSGMAKVVHVLRSRYTGDGSIGGLQAAELTVIQDVNQNLRKDQLPVFRWIHLEDMSMNLDEFQKVVFRITGLTEIERKGVSRLLARARRKYDKPMQILRGTKVRFMLPHVLQETLPQELRSNDQRVRRATLLCLPYFCLEKYTGFPASPRSSSHPMRTLLQTRFSLIQKERDMKQAVCCLLDTPAEHCFHIAQIWCLVLDDALLVTCARMSMLSLQGESITVASVPAAISPGTRSPTLLVSGGRSQLWAFQLDECLSWFAFISHFCEYWPRRFRVLHNGRAIKPDDWPKIIALARKSIVCLYLDFGWRVPDPARRGTLPSLQTVNSPNNDTVPPNTTPRGATRSESPPGSCAAATRNGAIETAEELTEDNDVSRPSSSKPDPSNWTGNVPHKGHEPTKTFSPSFPDALGDGFHIFTRLDGYGPSIDSRREVNSSPGAGKVENGSVNGEFGDGVPSSTEEGSMKKDLENMDRFLSREVSRHDCRIYQKCPQQTRSAIVDVLIREDEKANESDELRKLQDKKVDIFNAAESVFHLFLPFGFDGPTVGKYWGALYRLLIVSSPDRPSQRPNGLNVDVDEDFSMLQWQRSRDASLDSVHAWVGMIARQIQPFVDLLSTAKPSDLSNLELPAELPKAWLHLIMSLVVCTDDLASFEWQITTCSDLLDKGMRQVVRNVDRKSLLEGLVVAPTELALLISIQLLQDVTKVLPDISESYWEYLKGLESDIEANPLDRGHQDKLTLLKQEITVIRETLEQQRRVFESFQFLGRGQPPLARSGHRESAVKHNEEFHHSTRHTLGPAYSEFNRHNPRRDVSHVHAIYDPQDMGDFLYDPASQLSPTDPNGIQGLFIQDSLALLEKRIRDFKEMNDRASDLEIWNIQKIDSNKDRQEAAIFAFTIVTVIFLPLSAVAGILGMNTTDIRNMKTSQWVFWVVAIPLTVTIITLCLFYTGELQNFWTGFGTLWSGRGRGRGRRTAGYSNYYTAAGGPMQERYDLIMRSPPRRRSSVIPAQGVQWSGEDPYALHHLRSGRPRAAVSDGWPTV